MHGPVSNQTEPAVPFFFFFFFFNQRIFLVVWFGSSFKIFWTVRLGSVLENLLTVRFGSGYRNFFGGSVRFQFQNFLDGSVGFGSRKLFDGSVRFRLQKFFWWFGSVLEIFLTVRFGSEKSRTSSEIFVAGPELHLEFFFFDLGILPMKNGIFNSNTCYFSWSVNHLDKSTVLIL